MDLPLEEVRRIVRRALEEDLPWGDITTRLLIPPDMEGRARILAKAPGILAGLPVAREVFLALDPSIAFQPLKEEGSPLRPGEPVARLEGRLAPLLMGERTALNFLQRLSGIATLTARFVEATRGTGVRVLDTRKTTPGLRLLEKYAVRVGGGVNHRFCLSDGVLVKDNHLAALRRRGLGLREALEELRRRLPPTYRIEVEVESLEELQEALEAGADVVLLDNMPPHLLAQAVRMARGRALTEASGGIRLDNVSEVARAGVDFISVGALTHSAPALDMSMEVEE